MNSPATVTTRHYGNSDARFLRSTDLISWALCQGLSERRINLSSSEICELAQISRPTFYAHYKEPNNALHQYEDQLNDAFTGRAKHNVGAGRQANFTTLLVFMRENKMYFVATMPNANYWLLNGFFQQLREELTSETSDRNYMIYTQIQIAFLQCWMTYDDMKVTKIPYYSRKMAAVKLVDFGT